MFSLDRNLLREGTLAAGRLAALRKEAWEIEVFVPERGVKIFALWRVWRSARAAFRARKFSFVTVQDTAYLALLAYFVALRARVPLEVQVHGFEKTLGIRKMIAGFVLRRADKVRVVNKRLNDRLAVYFGVPHEKMYVLPIYTQTTPSTLAPLGVLPLRKGGEAEGNAFTFLTVGRLVPVKNIEIQIRAFAQIVREFPQARLRIVGSGVLDDVLKSHVRRLKLKDRVVFDGQQKNLARFYEAADVFLLTSNSEGWGVAIVEAAAFGVPIIMTDVGCAGEFIKNEENGIVIPVRNEDMLVSAMRRVMQDMTLRARLSSAARRSFESLPSAEEHIQKQAAAWRTLL